jgi:hypothetical protein
MAERLKLRNFTFLRPSPRALPDPGRRKDVQFWLQLLVIAAAILASVFFAWRSSKIVDPAELLEDPLILAIPALIAVYVLLRLPSLGILGLVAGSLIIPFNLVGNGGTGINIAVAGVAGLAGLWVFDTIVQRRPFHLGYGKVVTPLLVFTLIAVISFLVGQFPWFTFAETAPITAQVAGLAVFLLSALAFLLVGAQVRDLRTLQGMTWIFLGIGTVYLVGQAIPGGKALAERVLARGTFNSSMFWIWMVALSSGQAIFNTDLKPRWRIALGLLTVLAFFVTMTKNGAWTSGWLPAAAAFAVILLISRTRFSWLAIVIGIAALALKADSFERLLFAGDNRYSLMTRLEAWRIVAEIAKANPLLGLGPSNYYWYTPLFPILGWSVQFNSHNNYIDLIAQVGLLGLAAFFWFAWEMWWMGWGLRDRVPAGFARGFVYGALGGLAGTLVAGMFGDWFLPFIYNVGLPGFRSSMLGWAFLGGLLALKEMVHQVKA